MEGFHINFEEFTNQRIVNEYITVLSITPYYNQIQTSYVIASTIKGNTIMIIDKEKKILFKKHPTSKFPLTKIFFLNEYFNCAGECPLIYCLK